ncbi:uncharacterized protein LOC108867656 [Pyrus x bretschneideri]|uniref:uncharacterized protein LOC108867656 n=1 Tax=Pyrus x bretschneideri TaxID=225117 RepID=UPI00202FB8E6|nr:uncharacterized protein LOC108867656 [Pyrus x bretschneideri]
MASFSIDQIKKKIKKGRDHWSPSQSHLVSTITPPLSQITNLIPPPLPSSHTSIFKIVPNPRIEHKKAHQPSRSVGHQAPDATPPALIEGNHLSYVYKFSSTKLQKAEAGWKRRDQQWLSNLPDELIEKIITMLEMKDAIRTSILSKRWEYLWTSIPRLYLYHSNNAGRSPLVNVVDRALVLRGPADIEKFDLGFPVLGDACRVRSCGSLPL